MKKRKQNHKHLRAIIRRYKYHWNNAEIANELHYSPSYISQICCKPAMKAHIKWLKKRYGRPYYTPPIEHLLERPAKKPKPEPKKKLTRRQRVIAYLESLSEEQRYDNLLLHMKLNMAWRNIDKLPSHLRPLALCVWRAMKYQRPEDVKWLLDLAKKHGLGPFKRGGPKDVINADSFPRPLSIGRRKGVE